MILPADVTGDPDIENSEPDCVKPMLVTVPVLDGVNLSIGNVCRT